MCHSSLLACAEDYAHQALHAGQSKTQDTRCSFSDSSTHRCHWPCNQLPPSYSCASTSALVDVYRYGLAQSIEGNTLSTLWSQELDRQDWSQEGSQLYVCGAIQASLGTPDTAVPVSCALEALHAGKLKVKSCDCRSLKGKIDLRKAVHHI